MTVRDILRAKGSNEVYTISPDATIATLLDNLNELNVGAIVVLNSDDKSIVGIASERDLVRKLQGVPNPLQAQVRQIMSADVFVCAPDDSLGLLMETMTERRVRHIPVVEEGKLVGLVSIGDAVKFRMDQLEFERDQLTNYVTG
ncbi:MAG: CBS domain-containing protein [Aeromicrobium sp.]|nr:MAG: CBS domain-containing protein [Aeromicrobium sp.]